MATIFDWFDFELNEIKGIIRLDKVCIDNHVFRLHYKLTVPILVALSFLQACRAYFGNAIDCIQGDDVSRNVLETFCWIHSTFSLPDAWNKKTGIDVPYPGVDVFLPGEKRIYHKYYQWVGFVLFIQAALFYTPRYLWKMWEGGKMRSLVMHLNTPVMRSEDKEEGKMLLVNYLKNHMNNHRVYIIKFIAAEIFNFVNVLGQIYLINDFLGGAFTTYGIDVIKFSTMDQEDRVDPMVKVFPRMTKCTFHRFGTSGDVQKYDALCLLPLNIFNEKIYVFLWFWFIALSVMSAIVLFYRAILIFWPASRFLMLKTRSLAINKSSLNIVMSRSEFGDWFVFNLLAKNLDTLHFREVIDELAKGLKEEDRLMEKKSIHVSDIKPL